MLKTIQFQSIAGIKTRTLKSSKTFNIKLTLQEATYIWVPNVLLAEIMSSKIH